MALYYRLELLLVIKPKVAALANFLPYDLVVEAENGAGKESIY